MAPLTPQLELAIKDELGTAEILKWTEQPIPYNTMVTAFSLWFIAVPWSAFSYFWIQAAIEEAELGSFFLTLVCLFLL